MAAFEADGVVTIGTPFSTADLDAAEAAWDWLHPGPDDDSNDPAGVSRDRTRSPAFLATVAHPYLEEVAKQMLRSKEVRLQETFPHARPPTEHPADGRWPEWREVWRKGAHVDVQLTQSQWDATPRPDQLVFWLWLTDVHEESGAMRVLSGSHRPLQEHWENVLRPERLAYLPRTHGLVPHPTPGGRTSCAAGTEGIPELSSTPWFEQEPTAMVAKRGQMLAMTGSALHSGEYEYSCSCPALAGFHLPDEKLLLLPAWHNPHHSPRKAFIISWNDIDCPHGFEISRIEAMHEFYPKLREALPAERRHIVDTEVRHFESAYEDHWPETFVETQQQGKL
jgi:hypothetical protein